MPGYLDKGPHERHAAVAKPHMRHLHGHRRTVQHDDFMAPVELVSLTRRKSEGHIESPQGNPPRVNPRIQCSRGSFRGLRHSLR